MKVLIFLSIVAVGFGCESKDDSQDPLLEKLFTGELQVVDMTHTLSQAAPYWPDPSGNPFHYDTLVKQPSGAPAMGKYHIPEHFGTHLDAPIHSSDNLASVDKLTANELFGPAVVIDAREQSAKNADYLLTKQDLLNWEKMYGSIPARAIVLMLTGWGKKWNDYRTYKNEDANGKMHFPGFSTEAALFLTKERNILGIGIDTFSVDAAAADGFPVHEIVNGAGKFHLENVAHLHELTPAGASLIVAPIKLEGGSGGQVRIFGVLTH